MPAPSSPMTSRRVLLVPPRGSARGCQGRPVIWLPRVPACSRATCSGRAISRSVGAIRRASRDARTARREFANSLARTGSSPSRVRAFLPTVRRHRDRARRRQMSVAVPCACSRLLLGPSEDSAKTRLSPYLIRRF